MATRPASRAELTKAALGLPLDRCLRCEAAMDCDDESGLCLDCVEDVWRAS